MLKRLFGSSEPAGERHGLERRHLQVSVAVLLHEARRADYEHVDRLIGEGDTLLEGEVTVMHTPVHAPGHICLWHPRDRWLIA